MPVIARARVFSLAEVLCLRLVIVFHVMLALVFVFVRAHMHVHVLVTKSRKTTKSYGTYQAGR